VSLPAGQRVYFDPAGCKKYTTHGPVRNVVEWIERGWLAGLVLEPSVIDGKETPGEKVVVRWDVLLEGGHLDKMCTALDWKPADGFVRTDHALSRVQGTALTRHAAFGNHRRARTVQRRDTADELRPRQLAAQRA